VNAIAFYSMTKKKKVIIQNNFFPFHRRKKYRFHC